jgi:hypothetical protein
MPYDFGSCARCGERLYSHFHKTTCPYEPCDDPKCQALKEPRTLQEYKTALKHWRTHRFLNGCSHGCECPSDVLRAIGRRMTRS